MPPTSAPLHLLDPDLTDRRGPATLLVWGALGQWLVVDDELRALLEAFRGGAAPAQVLDRVAPATGNRRRRAEAAEALVELARRGILSPTPTGPPPPDDPVSLANVTFNLTNRCNLACAWCYNRGRRTDEIPIPTLLARLEEASPGGAHPVLEAGASLIVLGGEPTLDLPRLLALLDGAGRVFGPPPTVSTNGTLLDASAVSALAARRVEVQISLDSPHAAENDAVRGNGVWARATEAARALARAGVHVILSMVYTRHNVGAFEAYLDLAQQVGAREARFIPLRAIGAGRKHRADLPDQAVAFAHLLALLRRRPALACLLRRDWFTITHTVLGLSNRRASCGVGRRVVFIDADGAVHPCPNHVDPSFRAGHLRDQPLVEIVRRSPCMVTLREDCHVDRLEACASCPWRTWCGGDCRGEVRALGGDPTGPSPHCAELRRLFPEMVWLQAEGTSPLGGPRLADGRVVVDAASL